MAGKTWRCTPPCFPAIFTKDKHFIWLPLCFLWWWQLLWKGRSCFQENNSFTWQVNAHWEGRQNWKMVELFPLTVYPYTRARSKNLYPCNIIHCSPLFPFFYVPRLGNWKYVLQPVLQLFLFLSVPLLFIQIHASSFHMIWNWLLIWTATYTVHTERNIFIFVLFMCLFCTVYSVTIFAFLSNFPFNTF